MHRLAIILVALLLGLTAVPAISSAQLGPTNVPEGLTEPEEEVAAPIEEDTGVTTFQLVLIFGAAIGVIGLIAWVIMRDARTAAPKAGRAQPATDPASGTKGSKGAQSAREREREKARRRKAKAARDQRKRNRPR